MKLAGFIIAVLCIAAVAARPGVDDHRSPPVGHHHPAWIACQD